MNTREKIHALLVDKQHAGLVKYRNLFLDRGLYNISAGMQVAIESIAFCDAGRVLFILQQIVKEAHDFYQQGKFPKDDVLSELLAYLNTHFSSLKIVDESERDGGSGWISQEEFVKVGVSIFEKINSQKLIYLISLITNEDVSDECKLLLKELICVIEGCSLFLGINQKRLNVIADMQVSAMSDVLGKLVAINPMQLMLLVITVVEDMLSILQEQKKCDKWLVDQLKIIKYFQRKFFKIVYGKDEGAKIFHPLSQVVVDPDLIQSVTKVFSYDEILGMEFMVYLKLLFSHLSFVGELDQSIKEELGNFYREVLLMLPFIFDHSFSLDVDKVADIDLCQFLLQYKDSEPNVQFSMVNFAIQKFGISDDLQAKLSIYFISNDVLQKITHFGESWNTTFRTWVGLRSPVVASAASKAAKETKEISQGDDGVISKDDVKKLVSQLVTLWGRTEGSRSVNVFATKMLTGVYDIISRCLVEEKRESPVLVMGGR